MLSIISRRHLLASLVTVDTLWGVILFAASAFLLRESTRNAWVLGALLLACALWYYHVAAAPTRVYTTHSPSEKRMLEPLARTCLKGRGYMPTPYLVNNTVQTFFAAFGRPWPRVVFRREVIAGVYPDKELCLLDWSFSALAPHPTAPHPPRPEAFAGPAQFHAHLASSSDTAAAGPSPLRGGATSAEKLRRIGAEAARAPKRAVDWGKPPVVILFHGLTGGSADQNIYYVTESLNRRGWHVVVPIRRGCADSAAYMKGTKHYAYGNVEDTAAVVQYIASRLDGNPVFAAGLSAGSNVMCNYMGTTGDASLILGGVSVANGYCWERGTLAIRDHHPVWDVIMSGVVHSTLYGRHKETLRDNREDRAADIGVSRGKPRGMREYDEAVSRRLHGFDSLAEFYAEQSCVHRLHRIKVPTTFLNALDDPLSSDLCIPFDSLLRNPHALLVCTPSGGHLGWADGWFPFRARPTFMDRFITNALAGIIDEARHRAAFPHDVPVSDASAASPVAGGTFPGAFPRR